MNIKYKHIIVFIIFIILGSLLSIEHEQGAEWDTLNYHLYLPWAFFNNRVDIDLCPCGIHSYFNPVGMIPYYLLIKYFNSHPIMVAIIQGWNWSILGFLVYLISFEFIRIKEDNKRVLVSFLSSIIGATVMSIYMQIGLGNTGLSCIIPVLMGIYLLIRNMESNKILFLSSFFIGLSFGLKLTNAIYVIAIVLALSTYYLFDKKLSFPQITKKFLIYLTGSILGFLLINGYFMYVLYDKFNNPLFPFYNNLFNSELYTSVLYKDARYQPDHIWELLFLPVINIFQKIYNFDSYYRYIDYVVTDSPVYDMSFGIQYICAICLLFIKKLPIFKNKEITFVDFSKFSFLVYLYFFSYFIWVVKFSILRYFFGVLIFAGLFLVVLFLVFGELSKKYKICISIFLLLICIIYGTKFASYNHHRIRFTQNVIEAPDLKFEDNSVVLLTSKLMSYIALTQNKNVRYIGYNIISDGDNGLIPTDKYYQKAHAIMNEASKVYLIKTPVSDKNIIQEVNKNLKPELRLKGKCEYFQPNLIKHFNDNYDKYHLYFCE